MTGNVPSKPARLLIVDDSPTSVRLLDLLLSELDPRPITRVEQDGQSALAWLKGDTRPSDEPLPDLVLMDWRLPGAEAGEVIGALRLDPVLRNLPVIVFSASADPADVRNAYEVGANAYVIKADDLSGFRTTVRAIDGFWLRRNERPLARVES